MIQKGTSAVSPLFAALTARLMSIYGINKVQQDFQNGGYYRMLSFRDITTGNNGAYSAGVGWDALTGMLICTIFNANNINTNQSNF
jgi:kumamolisin